MTEGSITKFLNIDNTSALYVVEWSTSWGIVSLGDVNLLDSENHHLERLEFDETMSLEFLPKKKCSNAHALFDLLMLDTYFPSQLSSGEEDALCAIVCRMMEFMADFPADVLPDSEDFDEGRRRIYDT